LETIDLPWGKLLWKPLHKLTPNEKAEVALVHILLLMTDFVFPGQTCRTSFDQGAAYCVRLGPVPGHDLRERPLPYVPDAYPLTHMDLPVWIYVYPGRGLQLLMQAFGEVAPISPRQPGGQVFNSPAFEHRPSADHGPAFVLSLTRSRLDKGLLDADRGRGHAPLPGPLVLTPYLALSDNYPDTWG